MRYYLWVAKGAEHNALARLSMASVARHDPFAPVMHMDLDHPSYDTIRELPMMLVGLEAAFRVLADLGADDELVCLDTDTLALGPVDILDEAADMAVTYRHGEGDEGELFAKMPYNFGVLAFRGGAGGIEACLWLRERVRGMAQQWQDWYGNQMALAELLPEAPPEGTIDIVRARLRWGPARPGNCIAVRRLPCSTWNYTPRSIDEDVAGKVVLHFKGDRKALMREWATKLGLDQ
jgi:hypothetical protein